MTHALAPTWGMVTAALIVGIGLGLMIALVMLACKIGAFGREIAEKGGAK